MKLAPLAALLLVSACAPAFDRGAYLNRFVGAPESTVVQQFGVPTRTFQTGGHTYLAYDEHRSSYVPGTTSLFFGSGFYGPGFGYGFGFPSEVIPRVCETTFDIVQDRVVTWSLRGNACG